MILASRTLAICRKCLKISAQRVMLHSTVSDTDKLQEDVAALNREMEGLFGNFEKNDFENVQNMPKEENVRSISGLKMSDGSMSSQQSPLQRSNPSSACSQDRSDESTNSTKKTVTVVASDVNTVQNSVKDRKIRILSTSDSIDDLFRVGSSSKHHFQLPGTLVLLVPSAADDKDQNTNLKVWSNFSSFCASTGMPVVVGVYQDPLSAEPDTCINDNLTKCANTSSTAPWWCQLPPSNVGTRFRMIVGFPFQQTLQLVLQATEEATK